LAVEERRKELRTHGRVLESMTNGIRDILLGSYF
jgi:hypothetical protein